MFVSAFLKSRKEAFQRSVIQLNNRLVRAEGTKTKKILLLLPHCLQTTECTIRLTHNIYNCERSGRREIRDRIELAEENRLGLLVATGGTLARKIVRDMRPEA